MKKAFTLIELLIVVAIIGILAAIAVPNFLNAQMRARIANAESDMKTLDTALEMYRMDNNIYPPWKDDDGSNRNPVGRRLIGLSTPIAYISQVPQDPFVFGAPGQVLVDQHEAYTTYDYIDAWATVNYSGATVLSPAFRCSEWRINSYGPDFFNDTGQISYASTNGLKSRGDIIRTGPRTSFPCNDALVGK